MATDTDDLVVQLCTRAGIVMEDIIPTALTIGSLSSAQRAAAIANLSDRIMRAESLLSAAVVLTKDGFD